MLVYRVDTLLNFLFVLFFIFVLFLLGLDLSNKDDLFDITMEVVMEVIVRKNPWYHWLEIHAQGEA